MTAWRHASNRWRVHKFLVEKTVGREQNGRDDDRIVIGLGRWNEVMQEGIYHKRPVTIVSRNANDVSRMIIRSIRWILGLLHLATVVVLKTLSSNDLHNIAIESESRS